MDEPTAELLGEILGEVLQEAAFLFVEPAEEAPAWPDRVLVAEIAFESLRGGTLRLLAPPAVGIELAANMLGADPADPEAEENGRAALSEILNMLGGTFVTRWFGTKVPSQLGLPSVRLADPRGRRAAACAALARTEAGHPVQLELDLG